MRRTTISTLLWIFLAAVPAGWILGLLSETASGAMPALPWGLIPLFACMALIGFMGARVVRGWVAERRYDRGVDALLIARLVALSKAAAVFGAVAAGVYLGLGALAANRLTGTIARDRLLLAIGIALAGAVVTVGALRLERACEVPRPPSDGSRGNGAGPGGNGPAGTGPHGDRPSGNGPVGDRR